KPEVPGRIHLQVKGKSSKTVESEDEEVPEVNNEVEIPLSEEQQMPVDNSIPDDLPEGTIVVQPQAVEDTPSKKKKEPPVRIDTSILDNVSCTACGRQLNPYKSSALQKHPELKVVICKKCEKFLSSGEIAKDKDGTDEQCRWCGEGGRLVVCDQCSSAFCRACVMRNFNRSEFTNINSQSNWKCYVCDKAPLQGLREKYRKIRDTLKALQARDKAKASSTSAAAAANGTGRSENSLGSKKPISKSVPPASVAKNGSAASQKAANDKISSLQGDIVTLKDFTINFDNIDVVMDKVSTATNTFRGMLKGLRSQFHSTSPYKADDASPKFQFSFSNAMDLKEKKRRCAKAFDMGLQTYVKSLVSILSDTPEKVQEPFTASGNLSVTASASKRPVSDVSTLVSKQQSTSKSVDEHKTVSSSKKNESVAKANIQSPNKSNVEDQKLKKHSKEVNSESKKASVDQLPLNINVSEMSTKDTKSCSKTSDPKEISDKEVTSEVSHEKEREDKSTKAKVTHSKQKESEKNSEKLSIDKTKTDQAPLDENLAAKNDLLKEISDSEDSMEINDTSVEFIDNSEVEDQITSSLDQTNDSSLKNTDEAVLPCSEEKSPLINEKCADDKSAPRKEKVVRKMDKKIKDNETASSDSQDIVKTTTKTKTSASSVEKEKKKKKEGDKKEGKRSPEAEEERDSDSDLLYISEDDEPTQANPKKVMESKSIGLKLKISTKVEDKAPETSSPDKTQVNGNADKVDEIDKKIDQLSKLPTIRKRKVKEVEEAEETEKAEPEKKNPRLSKPGPKSSKKANDYDDLSSDGEDKKVSDHDSDDDDDDGPTVTFFVEPENATEDTAVDKENEMAKTGLLEDMEDEDNSEQEKSSSDESMDSETPKKTDEDLKKSNSEKEGAKSDDSEDSDDNEDVILRKKKKKIHSKLLDSKLSESDSDKDKTKKKQKKEDDDSSDSSIPSDASDEDEDDKDEEDDDDDDSDSKKKKKGKKGKKKKKGKGKKGSDEEEEEEEEGGKQKKGKRKRIKKMSDSSEENKEEEEEDDDDPNNSKSAGKRKQIRKVMSNKKLEDSTKAAAKAEEKRRKRIAAKQREFNIETITDENNPMNCPITTKLVLESGKEEGDEPVVQVNLKLVRKLKPHQVEAVQFLWDCLYESVKRSKKEQGAGCILAHCMGLGKTLSVIAFVHTILSHQKILKHKTCLVVSPLNTVLNWRNEWGMWLDEEDQLEVWELASCKQNAARASALKEWQELGGIMIIGYEMYRNLTTGARCKNKRQKKTFFETLVDPGPDLVVCDEGHILKNEASAISKAMNQMKTRRRVVLTGTPLQNNLNEYHCMVNFVKPNLLGTRKEFNNRFISPIQNGQCTDSTPRDVKLMKSRAHILHELLAGCVQRRDYSALTKFLPPKQEYVISVRLTNIQIELYEKYMELTGQGADGIFSNKGARLFTDYQNLMKIWTHPWVLKLAEIRDESKVKFDDEDSFIDDDESDEERSFSSSNTTSEDDKKGAMSDSGGEGTSSRPTFRGGTRRTRAKARRLAGEESDPEEVIAEWKSKTRSKETEDGPPEEQDKAITKEWWAPYVTEDDKNKLELSNKLYLLFEILKMCEEIGDKVLIFSQSILSLNIIENFLETVDSKYQQECDTLTKTEDQAEKESFGKSWTKNLDYYRMDGTTSAQNRQLWASNFNDIENYRARLFLISTRAGGLGINLVAANRVIIFDASWNPSHDVQSIFRVYRFGQTKPCYIYRYLAQGTMEEKIYDRQVAKLSLSQRVVDEHQIERHFSANDLKELYNFRPDRWDDGTEKPTLALPKDPLLAEILQSNRHCVVSFHEHDSLLENQVDQNLTEEEKKAAWEEYENEKKGIIVRGPGMERTASWPLMAAAQILTREEITATVHALRLQLPDIPEDLFHLHVQQALRRQVQLKQEELRRMELLRIQEMNYLNMFKQHTGLSHSQSIQALQNMAPWMQIQRLRAMQNQMMMGANSSLHPSASMSMLAQASQEAAERISNKPEEAIDLEDN
ncbi:transcriptional regulator ATRX, partial [Biomphalaria glabrata]